MITVNQVLVTFVLCGFTAVVFLAFGFDAGVKAARRRVINLLDTTLPDGGTIPLTVTKLLRAIEGDTR